MQHLMRHVRAPQKLHSLLENLSVHPKHESSMSERLVPRRHTEAICLLTKIMLTSVDGSITAGCTLREPAQDEAPTLETMLKAATNNTDIAANPTAISGKQALLT